MYRTFRDHLGRTQRVLMSKTEVAERHMFRIGFIVTCVGFAAVLTAVSGILR